MANSNRHDRPTHATSWRGNDAPWLTQAWSYSAAILGDVHRGEDGKITLVATVMMLSMVVLMGLIGNAGHTVNQKLETQHAADAATFSTALWMARGMNAVTATNHMLGEATALCAVHEALGGPGLDLKIKQNTAENQNLDRVIRVTKRTAAIGPSPLYVLPPLTKIDQAIIDFVTKRTTPASDPGFEAFATIYDSKMTLKRELTLLLTAKSLADVGFLVPPIFGGYVTAAIAYGVHIYSTAQIVLIGKEWVILEVLEGAAGTFTVLKRDVIEAQLIPTLAAHAEFVAGYDSAGGEFEAGILNSAAERMLLELQDRHNAELAVYPSTEKLRLPVEAEPKPNLRSGDDVAGWGSDQSTAPLPQIPGMDNFQNRLEKNKQDMLRRRNDLFNDVQALDGFEKEIDERLEADVAAIEKAELEAEKRAIATSRADVQQTIAKLQKDLDDIVEKQQNLQSLQQGGTRSQNPSVSRIPPKMNQAQEEVSQWVRAASPYTDAFRAPIRGMFQKLLPKSKAADHFTKWSNRYTMVKAWQFRSGYRIEKSGNTARWPSKNSVEPLSMLVLQDAFDGERSRKGAEPWTRSTEDGKQQAENYFTLIGFAQRDFEPLFSSVVYPSSSSKGITAYAQAIFYNANSQSSSSGSMQAKLGWDTLNWDPETEVPEWGAPPSDSAAKWPWDIFSSNDSSVKVKLNWQPKLMPVTESRLRQSDEELSGSMADNVDHAIEYFDALGTH